MEIETGKDQAKECKFFITVFLSLFISTDS